MKINSKNGFRSLAVLRLTLCTVAKPYRSNVIHMKSTLIAKSMAFLSRLVHNTNQSRSHYHNYLHPIIFNTRNPGGKQQRRVGTPTPADPNEHHTWMANYSTIQYFRKKEKKITHVI